MKRWFVIYRGDSRDVQSMITAFADKKTAEEAFPMWARWDSSRADRWELVAFPRTVEPRFRKKDKDHDPDVLEFHDVLEDLDRVRREVEVVATLGASDLDDI